MVVEHHTSNQGPCGGGGEQERRFFPLRLLMHYSLIAFADINRVVCDCVARAEGITPRLSVGVGTNG